LVAKKIFDAEFDLPTGFDVIKTIATNKSRLLKGDEKHSELLLKTEDLQFGIEMVSKLKTLSASPKSLKTEKKEQSFIFPLLNSLGA